ncbi:hypothetical protein [Halomonas rhizosphaerae]|uniref:Uncharacterized protein n=1 Tax=Halomonas rhizosphaerae TaxID=3043296 RepID=A0ABT6V0M5_9GAMM|nr:hypothetical protein [Halomonas rhizosphaerae]MDI5891780.1 hypothetical protein [Halomonas rhizosphaerae]
MKRNRTKEMPLGSYDFLGSLRITSEGYLLHRKYQKIIKHKSTLLSHSQNIAKRKSFIEGAHNQKQKNKTPPKKELRNFEDLSIKSKLFLIATIVSQKDIKSSEIEPLSERKESTLSPDRSYDQEILKTLLKEQAILTTDEVQEKNIRRDQKSHESTIQNQSFMINPLVTYEDMVSYIVSLKKKRKRENIIKTDEYKSVCDEVLLAECNLFANKVMQEQGITLRSRWDHWKPLTPHLFNFSIAQIQCLILESSKDVLKNYRKGFIKSEISIETIVTETLRNMQKTGALGWKVKPLDRDERTKMEDCSMLNKVAFNTICGMEDGGYSQPLNMIKDLGS